MYQPILPSILTHPNPVVVITTHHKPDGDAMGSTLGLFLLLKEIGIHAQVITPTDYADFLAWLPGNEAVWNFETSPQKCIDLVEKADFVFCLDFNKLSRINELGAVVANAKAQTFLMDHHQEPETFGSNYWWDPQACSTCEIVYRFIVAEGFQDKINKEIATCIYTGIMTDTGGFRHRGTNAQTHRIAAHLLELGVEPEIVHQRVWDSSSESRLRLLGFALSERMEVLKEFNTVLIWLSKEDLQRFQVKTGDTEGLVNYGLGITGVKLAALIIDRSVLVKMSFRSREGFDVNQFAKKHFSGGGHVLAAGGSSSVSLEETLINFKEALNLYKEQLR